MAFGSWGVQLLGGVLSAIYVPVAHGSLLETELLFQVGFGALLLRVTAYAARAAHARAGDAPATA